MRLLLVLALVVSAVPEAPRTVSLTASMALPSAGERNLSATVVEGELPAARTPGEVLTDTDCTPDEEMISRCRNEVLLPDGGIVVLRHPHDMTQVPCLAHGEPIRLVPAGV